MALTQDGRLLAIETPLGPNVLLLQQLTGTEDLSQPFAFTLDLLSETPHEIRSGQYALADFNFEMPSASLAVRVASVGGGPGARFELYDYPGEYRTRAQGERLARLRLQSEETSGQLATGASTCRAFSPGFRFDLQGHYRPDLDMSYVLLGVRHVASAGSSYLGGSRSHDDDRAGSARVGTAQSRSKEAPLPFGHPVTPS
jgi:uncharacterized protein involved in type VI secretion and phage assembly